VRYEQFRDRLEQAVRQADIPFSDFWREETIEFPSLQRAYRMCTAFSRHGDARLPLESLSVRPVLHD